jgi:hypothetical protein
MSLARLGQCHRPTMTGIYTAACLGVLALVTGASPAAAQVAVPAAVSRVTIAQQYGDFTRPQTASHLSRDSLEHTTAYDGDLLVRGTFAGAVLGAVVGGIWGRSHREDFLTCQPGGGGCTKSVRDETASLAVGGAVTGALIGYFVTYLGGRMWRTGT